MLKLNNIAHKNTPHLGECFLCPNNRVLCPHNGTLCTVSAPMKDNKRQQMAAAGGEQSRLVPPLQRFFSCPREHFSSFVCLIQYRQILADRFTENSPFSCCHLSRIYI